MFGRWVTYNRDNTLRTCSSPRRKARPALGYQGYKGGKEGRRKEGHVNDHAGILGCGYALQSLYEMGHTATRLVKESALLKKQLVFRNVKHSLVGAPYISTVQPLEINEDEEGDEQRGVDALHKIEEESAPKGKAFFRSRDLTPKAHGEPAGTDGRPQEQQCTEGREQRHRERGS